MSMRANASTLLTNTKYAKSEGRRQKSEKQNKTLILMKGKHFSAVMETSFINLF